MDDDFGREAVAFVADGRCLHRLRLRHHFLPKIIAHAIWLYVPFNLSLREVEEMLLERGTDVSYERIRRWTIRFGPQIAGHLRRRQPRPGDV